MDLYIAYGRPCAEAFQRHDNARPPRPGGGVLTPRDPLSKWTVMMGDVRYTGGRVHLIAGWYGPGGDSFWRTLEQFWILRSSGLEIIDRDEREVGMSEPGRDLAPWQKYPYDGRSKVLLYDTLVPIDEIKMEVERDPFEIIRIIGHMNMMRGKGEAPYRLNRLDGPCL